MRAAMLTAPPSHSLHVSSDRVDTGIAPASVAPASALREGGVSFQVRGPYNSGMRMEDSTEPVRVWAVREGE